jgi:hypothetical protein
VSDKRSSWEYRGQVRLGRALKIRTGTLDFILKAVRQVPMGVVSDLWRAYSNLIWGLDRDKLWS